jgi:hypothetical protein
MSEQLPSLEEWRQLYETATEFKKLRCWEWMDSDDIFGVQNPYTGEIGYCSILGNLGEVFGMAVYTGPKGLTSLLKIQNGYFDEEDEDPLHIQKSINVFFEDRNNLGKEDLSIIKELGLKFRGKKQWPVFRSFTPGYFPWFLNRDEVVFLTIAIQQAIEVALRVKADRELLISPDAGTFFVRMFERQGDKVIWKDAWMQGVAEEEAFPVPYWEDELRLRRLKSGITQSAGAWEADFFYAPSPVQEGGRPYFPIVFLLADCRSGQILNVHMISNLSQVKEFQEKFLQTIEKIKIIPDAVLIKREKVFQLLEHIFVALGISVYEADDLPIISEFKKGMFSYFA